MRQYRVCPRALITLFVFSLPALAAATTDDGRPNILLIVADDLAYADLGVHGSRIRTPHIDRLADAGLLLTQLHTAPMCAPTRAMLLTGNNNHVAGMARQSTPDLGGFAVPGYEASLSDRIVPFPRLLRDAGYHTYMVGKWHLSLNANKSPTAAGFSRSFSLLDGAGNHWNDLGFYEGGSTFWVDGDYADYPTGRYSTEVYTDALIDFIDAGKDDGKPFFAFAAYTSPHWPLQVPEDELDRYAGAYDAGYDALRQENFDNLKAAGIIPPDAALPPRDPAITPWEELTAEAQRRESRKMELYAAMVENLDHHVGRLLSHLRSIGSYDNTLIVFMSDNGAANEDFYNQGPYVDYVRAHYDNALANMGGRTSFVSYAKPWAEAGSAPFSRFKRYTRQGGIRAPMIMAGAGIGAAGRRDSAFLTVMDLAPTFLDIAGASYPTHPSIRPMRGESMRDFLAGKTSTVHREDYVMTLFHGGRALLRQGDWKLSTLDPPFDESAFQLHNLAEDPGETTDLREAQPEKFAELLDLWRAERQSLGIILPEDL